MSIMSDNWIRAQCEKPTHVVKKSKGGIEYASYPFTAFQKQLFELQKTYSELNITNNKIANSVATYTMDEINTITEEQFGNWKPMIHPFIDKNIRTVSDKKIISYGCSSFGYDVTLANKYKVFTNVNGGIIDPLNMTNNCYVEFEGDYCIIPPNSYLLGHTVETFCIPNDILVICTGKSTYARIGAIINVTPIEPGFEGQVVIEISNATTLPLKVYANMGIAQFMFFEGNERCNISYKEKGGKYQGQTGITTARL